MAEPRPYGLSLHMDQLEAALHCSPRLAIFELITDNLLSPGPHHSKALKLREKIPMSFHCVNMNIGGTDPISLDYLSSIKELASKFAPIHISDHLCLQSHEGTYFHDLLPIPFSQESLDNCCRRVNTIQDFLAEEILIENLSYYGQYECSEMREGEFLRELSKRTGCRLLLDLNNIWVNQLNMGLSVQQFMDDIPLDSVGEVHLAGPEKQEELYVDTHGSQVSAEVLNCLQSLNLPDSAPIIYERDRNIPCFDQLRLELFQIEQAVEGRC